MNLYLQGNQGIGRDGLKGMKGESGEIGLPGRVLISEGRVKVDGNEIGVTGNKGNKGEVGINGKDGSKGDIGHQVSISSYI